MTSLDVGYQNQADLTRGVAIFTDAMRSVVRRELEARDGAAWWDIGVWPWLSPGQRKAIDESRSNDSSRPPEDFLDASHFRAVMLDSGANYPLFARYLPGRGEARRAFETARQAKNLLVSHRRSGDTPAGAAIAALEAMQLLVARADGGAADELGHLLRGVIARRDAGHADRPTRGAPSTTCALCAQRIPERVILIERGSPRHVDARAYASACERLFGAPLCANHLRAFDPYNAAILDGRVIGHTRSGLVVDVAGKEGFVPRRYSVTLRVPFLSDADAEALLVQQRGRAIRLQAVDQGDGRRPVWAMRRQTAWSVGAASARSICVAPG